MSMEIERLNHVLRQKLDEGGLTQRELTEFKSKFPQLVEENTLLKRRIEEVTQKY
jgi:FtsZ-binding cell division protein ZapB